MHQFHVMFLTRQQQVTLRLLLFDLLAKHVRLNSDQLAEDAYDYGQVGDISGRTLTDFADKAYRHTVNAIDLYERITEALPTVNTMSMGRDITWQVDMESMKHVVLAVNSYDITTTVLSGEERRFVADCLTEVKKLVNKSKEFTYTAEDVRRAKGDK